MVTALKRIKIETFFDLDMKESFLMAVKLKIVMDLLSLMSDLKHPIVLLRLPSKLRMISQIEVWTVLSLKHIL